MIGIAAALVLAPQAQPAPTAGQVISKMMAKYYGAKSLSANIEGTYEFAGSQVKVNTQLHYKRPGQIVLTQQKIGTTQATYRAVSDGKLLVYPNPIADSPPTLKESAVRADGSVVPIGEVLSIARAAMAETNPALELLVAFTPDLQQLRLTWNDLKMPAEMAEVRGSKVYYISGVRRRLGPGVDPDTFEMFVSPEWDLVAYRVSEAPTFVVNNRMDFENAVKSTAGGSTGSLAEIGGSPIAGKINSVWFVDAKVDVPISDSVFAIR